MRLEALFPSVLGTAFSLLDPKLRWVHSGEGRDLSGTVTVERGTSFTARILGALTSLPPALSNGQLLVRIESTGGRERWLRTYTGGHQMSSTLCKNGDALAERVGPAVLTFRIVVRDSGMDWQLQKVSMLGVPLPARWFEISARVDMQKERYHFLIDSALRGIGRIARYEGLLDVNR
jgi:uncharacterized protein DUF4166